MAKQVRALTVGFYKGTRIRPGTVFAIPDNAKVGKWMEEVPATKPAAPNKLGVKKHAEEPLA